MTRFLRSSAFVFFSIIFVVLLLLVIGVNAQTAPAPAPVLVTKAPPKSWWGSPCTATGCSGFYVGINLAGLGSSIPAGNGLAGGFAGGGLIGAQAGYQFWTGQWFWAAEVFGDYDSTNSLNTVGSAGGQRWVTGEVVKLGGALAGLLGSTAGGPSAPSQAPVPIPLPAGLGNMLAAPYGQAGAVQRSWGSGWGVGAGLDLILVQNWNLDISYLYVNYGAIAAPFPSSENIGKIGLNYKF